VLIASISSSTFIVPIWAVKAAPERRRRGPNSGSATAPAMPSAMPSGTNSVAPEALRLTPSS